MDCLEILDKKWHTANVSIVCRDYKKAGQLCQSGQDRASCDKIKNSIIQYINAVYRAGKISLSNAGRAYGEIKFPKIYKLIKKPFLKAKGLKRWLCLKKQIKRSDIVLLNTITHGNLGDQAIVLSEIQMMNEIFPNARICELKGDQVIRHLKRLVKVLPQNKPIFIQGGGNIGSIWEHEEIKARKMVQAFSNHRLIFLPQTVTFDMQSEAGRQFFEESKKIYTAHKNLTIFVREQKSLDFMGKNMPDVDCRLVPDIVLSYRANVEKKERNGVLLCLRSDIEKSLVETDLQRILASVNQKYSKDAMVFTDTVVEHDVSASERQEAVRNKLQQFGEAELIITDRLHGMIFAFLAKTPCIAMGNINGKVGAVYQWFSDCPYVKYIDSADDLPDALKALENISADDMRYTMDGDKFASLKAIIREEMKGLL